ncbi:MAG: glycoside hydrolase [Verrucomicrobia bacterium]|nr:glycoside hydrolase [Verrucomicrobiota bacterium]
MSLTVLLGPAAPPLRATPEAAPPPAAAHRPQETGLEPFLGEPRFTLQPLSANDRFPNVVVAVDGTVLAFWNGVQVRRSGDGGRTWPVKRLVYDGPFAYSSLEAGRPGTPSEGWIYLLFEGGPRGGGTIARFNLSWVLEGQQTDGEGAYSPPADL